MKKINIFHLLRHFFTINLSRLERVLVDLYLLIQTINSRLIHKSIKLMKMLQRIYLLYKVNRTMKNLTIIVAVKMMIMKAKISIIAMKLKMKNKINLAKKMKQIKIAIIKILKKKEISLVNRKKTMKRIQKLMKFLSYLNLLNIAIKRMLLRTL